MLPKVFPSIFLWSLILLCLTFRESSNSLIRSVSTLFTNCHFKFISLQKIFPVHSRISHDKIISESIITAASEQSIISVNNFNIDKNISQAFAKRNYSYFPIRKFLSCFVHVYFLPNYNSSSIVYSQLEVLMNQYRSQKEWPHHFMFFGTIDKNFSDFSTNVLPRTFVRGLVLVVDNHNIRFICISCVDNPLSINISKIPNIQEMRRAANEAVLHLHGGFVESRITLFKLPNLKLCNMFEIPRSENIRKGFHSSVCTHHLISAKLNYTHDASVGFKKVTMFRVDELNLIGEKRYKNTTSFMDAEWIPYGTVCIPFGFIAYQETPQLSRSVLIKPYHWISWIFFILCALCLLIVTVSFRFKTRKGLSELNGIIQNVLMSLFASLLDQSTASVLRGRIPYNSEMLGFAWLLWHLGAIVLENGYLSMVYAILTMGPQAAWPQDLVDLVNDPAYLIVSTDVRGKFFENGTVIFGSLLDDTLLAPVSEGSHVPHGFAMLSKSYKFYNHFEFDLAADIVKKNSQRARGRDAFHVGNDKTAKFAFVDINLGLNALYINFFTENTVMAPAVYIPGYQNIAPFGLRRNFFHERFMQVIATLVESGIYDVIDKHMEKWIDCDNLRQDTTSGKTKANASEANKRFNLLQCFDVVLHKLANADDFKFASKSQSIALISFGQLSTTFELCLVLFGIAIGIFLAEVILKRKHFVVDISNE